MKNNLHTELRTHILEGLQKWSEMVWKSELFQAADWDGPDEISASIQSFIGIDLLDGLTHNTLEELIEKLEKIKDWPEPDSRAGEGGPGPLFTLGILTQYKADRENHKAQIEAILLEAVNQKTLDDAKPIIDRIFPNY